MAGADRGPELGALCALIQETIAPYAGRVDYGNLRQDISHYDCGNGGAVTNVALVYETPGGSTDQINISYNHETGLFSLIDAHDGELTTPSVEVVVARVRPRVSGIPHKRQETLNAEIQRHLENGSNTAGVVGLLNRMMQSAFKGGTITHLEMRDAMTFAVQFMKARN